MINNQPTELQNTQAELSRKNYQLERMKSAILNLAEDLNSEKKELKSAKEKIQNVLLELKRANKKLESFSYSVSHDLRAPLTRVDGFSKALLTEYEHQLDDQAVHYLNRIRASCQNMANLIDDLLSLSRLNHQNLQLKKINLSQFSEEIIKNLKESDATKRDVKLNIEENIEVIGDRGLIYAAMENLLSNAWKFTEKTENAKIEIGQKSHSSKNWIYVKDNGVGFDMKYVDQLFTPFRRLHSSEYKGSGIGLSTVQQIIHRHNGEVWAEGKINNGCTIYFSLNS